MIARYWRGWTTSRQADAYEKLLTKKVLPSLRNVEGYRGGYLLRSDLPDGAEFVVLNLFDSLDSVKRFAGSHYTVPVFEPQARKLLCKIDPVARHYEVRAATV
jgi:hypothetical protein